MLFRYSRGSATGKLQVHVGLLPSGFSYHRHANGLHNNWTVTINLYESDSLTKRKIAVKWRWSTEFLSDLFFLVNIWFTPALIGLKWTRLHSTKVCYHFYLGK